MVKKDVIKNALKVESKGKRGALVAGQGLGAGLGFTGFIVFLRSMGWAFWPESNDVWIVATFGPLIAGVWHTAAKFMSTKFSFGKGLSVLAVCGLAAMLSGCGHEQPPTLLGSLFEFLEGELGVILLQFILNALGL